MKRSKKIQKTKRAKAICIGHEPGALQKYMSASIRELTKSYEEVLKQVELAKRSARKKKGTKSS